MRGFRNGSVWPVLALVGLAWTPLVTHPVKDAATEEMLGAVAQENDRVVREEAQAALEFIAGKAVTNLVVALPVVATAEWSDAEVLARLQAGEIRIQEAAVHAAGERGLTNAVPVLTGLLDDEDERLRGAVCGALATLRAGAPAVARRLTVEPSARIRRAAVAVLLAVHDAATLRLVQELLGHARWQAREAAAATLAAWGDRSQALGLVPLLSDESEAVQVAAARGLAVLRHPATEAALRERLPAVADPVKVSILEALGALGSRAAVPAMVAFVKGTNDVVGVAAAKALRSIEHEAIVPAFREIIFKVSYWQLETRVEVLRQLRERGDDGLADRMVQFVTEKVVPPPPMGLGPMYDSVEARMEALRYLQRFGRPEHGARLWDRLTEVVPVEMRPLLAETLTKLTGRRYQPLPDQNYRRYFVESLGPPPWPPTPVPGVQLEQPPGQPRREQQ